MICLPPGLDIVDRRPWSRLTLDQVDIRDVNRRLLDLYNSVRTGAGLGELEPHEALVAAAEEHTTDMAAHNHLSHYGIGDRSTWAQRAMRHGYPGASLLTVNENVAAGQRDPMQVVDDYRQSVGHWRAIMNPRAIHVGSAAAIGPRGYPFWCSDFGWGGD